MQYFWYWFAFYAIKGGDGSGSEPPLRFGSASLGYSVRKAADALHLPHLRGGGASREVEAMRHPYLALLRQFLVELIPRPSGMNGTAGSPGLALTSSAAAAAGGGGGSGVGHATRSRLSATAATTLFNRPSASLKSSIAGNPAQGLLFYSILLEFWLSDADEPVPIPTSTRATGDFQHTQRLPLSSAAPPSSSPGISMLWSTTYEPPSEDLLEALGEVIRYVTVNDGTVTATKRRLPAQGGSPWLPLSPVSHILLPPGALLTLSGSGIGGCNNSTNVPLSSSTGAAASLASPPSRLGAAGQPSAQAFSCRLFRVFYRAFASWPDQRTMKPALRAFIAYVAPWRVSRSSSSSMMPGGGGGMSLQQQQQQGIHLTAQVSDFVHRVGGSVVEAAASHNSSSSNSGKYSEEWEGYVLANLPFYTILLPLFLGLSIGRVEVRGESAAQDVLSVLGVLESSPDLISLLSSVERDLSKYMDLGPRRAEGPYAEMLPWLTQQLHGWVAAASTNTAGDSPYFKASPHPTMFAVTEGSGAHIAQNILEISSGMLKTDHFKRLQKCVKTVLPIDQLALMHGRGGATTGAFGDHLGVAYDDTIPRLPRSTWKDVKYKGDALRRPVASYEIAMLVLLTVRASEFLNKHLGLDGGDGDGGGGGRERGGGEEEEVPENVVQQVLQKVRRRKYKVDLRPLADVRNLVWIPVAWFTLVIVVKIVAVICAGIVAGLTAPPSNTSSSSNKSGWGGGVQSTRNNNNNNVNRQQAARQRQQREEEQILRRPHSHLARQLNQEL
jgi:hypothetical protein